MRNVSDKIVQKIKIQILCSTTFSENRAVCEIMWKNYGTTRQATDDNITRRMGIVCWITKATDTHSECVTLIAFPRQQWLAECTTTLR
jgi:hypothetical protein